jgi:hypothetical protein
MGGQNQCHICAPTLAVSKCASKGEGGGGQGGTLNVKRLNQSWAMQIFA